MATRVRAQPAIVMRRIPLHGRGSTMTGTELLRPRTYLESLRPLGIWTLLVAPVGLLAGSASAFFLWSLDRVTQIRFDHPWILFLLPLAGIVMAWVYRHHAKNAGRGNNLLIDEIRSKESEEPGQETEQDV